jgi:large conductance mechanosensitive channel
MTERLRDMLREFKEFALEGNVLELAIAFVLGLYFKQVIDALVNGVILNAIGGIFGQPSFNDLTFTIGDGVIQYGALINAIVTFLIVAASLFFVVKVFDTAKAMQKRGKPGEPPEKRDCPRCFTEIPARATRCPACTEEIQPVVA